MFIILFLMLLEKNIFPCTCLPYVNQILSLHIHEMSSLKIDFYFRVLLYKNKWTKMKLYRFIINQ